MSTEWLRQVFVKPDGVYLYSKSNNDDRPYRMWRCDSLTEIYHNEGQKGLDREIVKMLSEYALIKGNHPSMERYRPCLLARGHFSIEHVEKLDADVKLTPEDLGTSYFPDDKKPNK